MNLSVHFSCIHSSVSKIVDIRNPDFLMVSWEALCLLHFGHLNLPCDVSLHVRKRWLLLHVGFDISRWLRAQVLTLSSEASITFFAVNVVKQQTSEHPEHLNFKYSMTIRFFCDTHFTVEVSGKRKLK